MDGSASSGAAPESPRSAGVLAGVGVAALISTLDGQMLNVALPDIGQALGAPVGRLAWVVTTYLLVMAATLLAFGRLGDMLGLRRMYLAGLGLFGGAAVVSAAAPTLTVLIAGRGLQALGASITQAVLPAIVVAAFPDRSRGRALGLLLVFTYLGLTAGPLVGGWLAGGLGWRSIFLVDVPGAVAAAALALRFVPPDRAPRGGRFDLVGAVLWAVGLCVGVTLLDPARRGGFESPAVIGGLAVACIAVGLFVAWERRRPDAMVDLSLFRNATFSGAAASALANYVAVSAILFLTPFLLTDRGMTPPEVGATLVAMPLAMVVCAPLSGELSDRVGTEVPAAIGLVLLALGILGLRTGAHPRAWLALGGAGTGVFISPNTSALLGSAPRERAGIASGVVATARTAGMAVGVTTASLAYGAAIAHGGPGRASYAAGLVPAVIASVLGAGASLLRAKKALTPR